MEYGVVGRVQMMRWLLVCVLCVCSGCVSIFRSSDAEIMVHTEPAGALASYRGQSIRTPGFLHLPRDHPGQIRIAKPGFDNAFVNFDARPDAGIWTLSILSNASHGYFTLGVSFIFGMIVDVGSGALNSFDGPIEVRLQASLPAAPPSETPPAGWSEPTAAQLATPEPEEPDQEAAPVPPEAVASEPETETPEGVTILDSAPSFSATGPGGPAPERVPLSRAERVAYDSYRAALDTGTLAADDPDALGRVLHALRTHAQGSPHADAVLSEFATWVLLHPAQSDAEIEQRWQVVSEFYR